MHPALKATLFKGVGFSLPAFMAGQSDGFWYDFTKTDRLFQENVGPTPAATANDVIGLALSQRLWNGASLAAYLASQSELLSNGDFAAGATGWTTTSWVISGGAATITNVSDSLAQPVAFVAGRMYAVTYTLTGFAGSGAFRPRFFGGTTVTGSNRSVDGTYTDYMTAVTGNVTFAMTPSTATCSGTVDNISVKEISRYPATQSTGSFKPTVQSGGAKGDATDDRHGTGFASSSGDAFNVYPAAIIPASLAATQVFAGAMDGSSNGDYLAVTTGGALRAKVGATTLDSTGIDLRGGTHDLAYWTDGATLYLYADGAIVASGPWTGSRPTTAWNLFALNNNGTASSFTGATMKAALRGAQALTVSLANQICRAA